MRVLQFKSWKNGRAYQDTILRLRFNADGSEIAARFQNGIGLTALECHTGRVVQLPFIQGIRPTCHAYSWDGEYIAVGDAIGVARSHRLRDYSLIAELAPGLAFGGVFDVAFAPSDEPTQQWLAVCGNEFWLWNPVSGQYLVAPERESFFKAAFDSAAESVVVLSGIGVTRFRLDPFRSLWHVPLERLTGRATHPQMGRPTARLATANSVAVAGDGVALHVLDTRGGDWHDTIRLSAPITDITFLPNSRLLAVADGSPTLRVYDMDNGRVAREYDWGIGGIHCVTFSNDGAMGAAGGDKGRVAVWDLE